MATAATAPAAAPESTETSPVSPRFRVHAIKHGAHGQSIVLPQESLKDFVDLYLSIKNHYGAQTGEECTLVETLCGTEWRINRLRTIESGILALATAEQSESVDARFPHLNDDTRDVLAQAAGFLASSRALEQISRQEGRLRRLFERTCKELEGVIARRELPSAAPVPSPSVAPHREVGFVPSNFSEAPPDPAPAASATPETAPAKSPTESAPRPAAPKFSGPQRKQHRKQWLREQARKNQAAAN